MRSETPRPAVIDVHAHVMPSGLQHLSKIMKTNGVEIMVNLSGGSNVRAFQVRKQMSEIVPGLLHFYTPAWRERIQPGFGAREAAKLEVAVSTFGYRGLKIAKALGLYLSDELGHRIPVDWPELDPLWAKAGRLGVPVAIHTSDPRAFWEPADPLNERYEELSLHPNWSFYGPEYPSRELLLDERDRVIERHPGTTFICVHLANSPEDLEVVDRLLRRHSNVMLDISARVPEIGRHDPKRVREFFITHQDRILFGTDLGLSRQGLMLGSTGSDTPTLEDVKPFFDAHYEFLETDTVDLRHPTPVQGDWSIDGIGLPTEVLQKVYRDNALRVLRITGVPRSPSRALSP
jgi:predicted TIM-barrel fold metal-dependent hydrolase